MLGSRTKKKTAQQIRYEDRGRVVGRFGRTKNIGWNIIEPLLAVSKRRGMNGIFARNRQDINLNFPPYRAAVGVFFFFLHFLSLFYSISIETRNVALSSPLKKFRHLLVVRVSP